MMRGIVTLGAIALVTGCHAPAPNFNLLAPYGPTRVPPPGTGSYGTAGSYYQNPTGSSGSQPIGSGLQSKKVNSRESPGADQKLRVAAAGGDRQSSSSKGKVATVGFQSSTGSGSTNKDGASEPRIRIVERSGAVQTGKSASQPDEPGRFDPPDELIDISKLPRAPRPVTATMSAPPSAASGAEAKSTATGSKKGKEASAGGWRSRDDLRSSVRIAGR